MPPNRKAAPHLLLDHSGTAASAFSNIKFAANVVEAPSGSRLIVSEEHNEQDQEKKDYCSYWDWPVDEETKRREQQEQVNELLSAYRITENLVQEAAARLQNKENDNVTAVTATAPVVVEPDYWYMPPAKVRATRPQLQQESSRLNKGPVVESERDLLIRMTLEEEKARQFVEVDFIERNLVRDAEIRRQQQSQTI